MIVINIFTVNIITEARSSVIVTTAATTTKLTSTTTTTNTTTLALPSLSLLPQLVSETVTTWENYIN